eukprot:PhM_4_TR740/c0_g1_i1/m.64444
MNVALDEYSARVAGRDLSDRAKQLFETIVDASRISSPGTFNVRAKAADLKRAFKDSHADATEYQIADYDYDVDCAVEDYQLRHEISGASQQQNSQQASLDMTPVTQTQDDAHFNTPAVPMLFSERKRARDSDDGRAYTPDTHTNDHMTPQRLTSGELASLEEIRSITLTARSLKQYMHLPSAFGPAVGMYLRTRTPRGYMLLLIKETVHVEPYSYDGERFNVGFRVASSRGHATVKMDAVSNSPVQADEYAAAVSAGLIPSPGTVRKQHHAWHSSVVLRPVDAVLARESVLLQRQLSDNSNVVLDKVQIQKLLQTELTPDHRARLEEKLASLEDVTHNFITARNGVVDYYVNKTRQNKEFNRRTPDVWKEVSTTVYARVARGSTFWEDSAEVAAAVAPTASKPAESHSPSPTQNRHLLQGVHAQLPTMSAQGLAELLSPRVST